MIDDGGGLVMVVVVVMNKTMMIITAGGGLKPDGWPAGGGRGRPLPHAARAAASVDRHAGPQL